MPDISNNSVFSQTDASNNTGTAPSWAEGQLPSTVNDSARALQGAIKRWHDRLAATVTSGGSANAQTLTYTVAPTAYVAGDRYTFKVGGTNTGATTLNVNSLGAKDVLIVGSALQGGELKLNQIVDVVYDGTQFQLLRPTVAALGAFTPANPTATTSTTGVMMGVGSSCTITPNVSGAVKFWVTGHGSNATNADTVTIQIRYGTGAAPANGAALTGTAIGKAVSLTSPVGSQVFPFALVAYQSGLTVGTTHWIDVTVTSGTGGSAVVQSLAIVAEEVSR